MHFRDIYKQRVILTKNDLIYATVKINGCINAKMLLVKTHLVDKILETYFALWLQTMKSIILHRCRLFRSKYKILQIQVKLFCLYFKIHKVLKREEREILKSDWRCEQIVWKMDVGYCLFDSGGGSVEYERVHCEAE